MVLRPLNQWLKRFDTVSESRYTRPMPSSTPLPPHLERFVHQQIALGRYHSEDEVIRAALQHLVLMPPAGPSDGSQDGSTARSWSGRPQSALDERWVTPGEWLDNRPAKEMTPPPRRCPRGLLADLRSGLSFDEVRETREELWAGLHSGGA